MVWCHFKNSFQIIRTPSIMFNIVIARAQLGTLATLLFRFQLLNMPSVDPVTWFRLVSRVVDRFQ